MPFHPTNRNADRDADKSSLNVTTIPTHTLPGSDTVRPPEKTKSSLKLADPNYSKRPSEKSKDSPLLICVNFVSILPDLC
jgi:hypothetical protein